MSTNPYYNGDPPQSSDGSDHGTGADPLKPAQEPVEATSTDAAVELIRRKLAAIYQDEPDAKQELQEAEAPVMPGQHHSKHQRYMQSLHASGMSMTDIQTAWHKYYQELPDAEKHEVWQEFYSQSAQAKRVSNRIQPVYQYQPDTPVWQGPAEEPSTTPEPDIQQPAIIDTEPVKDAATAADSDLEPAQPYQAMQPTSNPLYGGGFGAAGVSQPSQPAHEPTKAAQTPTPEPEVLPATPQPAPAAAPTERPADVIRKQLRQKVSSRGAIKAKHHLQSLLFGLGFGGLVVVLVLFSFFNEVVIAPFIQPSRKVSATPIIVSPDGITPTKDNEVIIPKINVQIPLDFSPQTTDEKEFEAALDRGVTHYPTTAVPGQQGNASFFGHSSNNIFNPGKYKFAFVLLNELVPGDMFYLTYNGTVYSYQVYDKKVVAATAVEILNPVPDKKATAMLVTCDPPGTSLHRLAVWGEQVSPNPNNNAAAGAPATAAPLGTTQTDLPGNGPTLWRRLLDSI